MRRLLNVLLPLVLSVSVVAADVDPKLDRAVRDAVPVCAEATISYGELAIKLPARFKGARVLVESPRRSCEGQYAAVLSPAGNVFVGIPWPIEHEEGRTIEEKLRNFTWRAMGETITATVDRTPTTDGLFRVTLAQITESGRMPMQGVVDPDGRIFFFGQFRKADMRAARSEALGPVIANAPASGPANAAVTVVEFSDFQCPSCARSANLADLILTRYDGKVRHVRSDLPLSGHSWAFPAALAGRAIHRQKPEAFWAYKKQVYDNQENLNPFTFWDWARNFAGDHELDLERYDADLSSDALKAEILEAAGSAFSNDIGATPTFMVNGALVDPGDEGKHLLAYIDGLLK